MTAYTVRGPQSACPFPNVNEATCRSEASSARNDLLLLSGKNDRICCGSSVSTETSYSLKIRVLINNNIEKSMGHTVVSRPRSSPTRSSQRLPTDATQPLLWVGMTSTRDRTALLGYISNVVGVRNHIPTEKVHTCSQ